MAALLVGAVACGSKDQTPVAGITPASGSESHFSGTVQVPSEGKTFTVGFHSNLDWSVLSDAKWVSVSPDKGSAGDMTLEVKVSENKTLESRSAKVTIQSADVKALISITQSPRASVPLTGLKLTPPSFEGYAGETCVITVTPEPANADWDGVLSWTSSDASVATVSNGTVTAVHEGQADITVTGGGKSARCAVKVLHTFVPAESVSLDNTEGTIFIGETLTLNATVLPANADETQLTWTSSNPSVATVEGGVVTGVAVGTAVITVKVGADKTAVCTVAVQRKGSHGEDLNDPVDTDPWNE